MSILLKYLALDGKPATREKHTDILDAHNAAGYQSERLGVSHWVEVGGVVCPDCKKAYQAAGIQARDKQPQPIRGLGAWPDFDVLSGIKFKDKKR